MKNWLGSLGSKYESGAAHTFLLYLNVADNILEVAEDKSLLFFSLSDYLIAKSPLSRSRFVATFNLGIGISFKSENMEKQFLSFLERLKPRTFDKSLGGGNIAVLEFLEKRRDPTYALNFFYEMMRLSWDSPDQRLKDVFKDVFPDERIEDNIGNPFFSAILEYSETLIPPDSASSSCNDDRCHLVSLLILAKDQRIREARNILVCLAESLNSVAIQLRSETNCLIPFKINFPDFGQRGEIISLLRGQYPLQPKEIDTLVFARQSAGMTCNIITSLIREKHFKREPVTSRVLFEKKKKFIDEQSGGLVEIIEPLCGIETIGGLEEHKQYVIDVVKDMKSGRPLAVPMGILLLGAQGTGKSVFAEAIAREAELPFFRFKNLREKWVGSSERNQDFAIELILANAPAVAFIDEFDQQMQMRVSGLSDNTGVNQRLEGRWKEIMSNTLYRGKILWLAASNRPDMIDPAYLREGRFDDKIPFFPLSSEGRADIVRALLRKNEIMAKEMRINFEWDLCEETINRFARLTHGHLTGEDRVTKCDPEEHHIGGISKKEDQDEIYFTGGQIENIIRVAIRLSEKAGNKLTKKSLFEALDEHIPPKDMITQKQMTELAMFYCNSQRFIPKEGRWHKAAKTLGLTKTKEGTKLKL